MRLNEVVFNRELVKTPHPMYDRFWLVSWFFKISPKDLVALWVFPNKAEWEHCTKSRDTERVRDLIKDKYLGDYLVPFKSDNGVYMAAILSSDYVRRHGNTLNIIGASMTEKSAIAAAKKTIEDKGHRWDDNYYSIISMEPRDPSIFRLDPDEDIDAITESLGGRGKQVMEFSDYMHRLEQISPDAAEQAVHFKKFGAMLFKEGFEYNDTQFSQLRDGTGLYEFDFPAIPNTLYIERGWVNCHFVAFVAGEKKSFQRLLKASTLASDRLAPTLAWIRETALNEPTY